MLGAGGSITGMDFSSRKNRRTIVVSAALVTFIGLVVLIKLLLPDTVHPNLIGRANVQSHVGGKAVAGRRHGAYRSTNVHRTDYKFAGVWTMHQPDGFEISAVVYPMHRDSFIVECVCFNTRRPLVGCLILQARQRQLDGSRYFFCQLLLPDLTRQTQNMASMLKALHSATPADRPFLWKLMRTAGKTGMGKLYVVVKLDAISPDSLTVTPLFHLNSVDGLSHSPPFSGEALLSPADLASYVNGPIGRTLAAQTPLVLHRASVATALPDLFYASP